MFTAQERAWLDQQDAKVASDIRTYGVHLVIVGSGCCGVAGCVGDEWSRPDFAYTVGLFGLGHPELLIFGAGAHTAGGVLTRSSPCR